MTYDILISVDIGLRGAIAFFETEEKDHPSGGLLSIHPMPVMPSGKFYKSGDDKPMLDLDKLLFLMERPHEHGDRAIVVYENIHAFKNQGVVSVGTFLEEKGIIRGLTKALGYDEVSISPRTWQSHFEMIPPKDLKGKSTSQTKTLRKKWLKKTSVSLAKYNFPEWADKIVSDGLSDTILLGKYWLDTQQGN